MPAFSVILANPLIPLDWLFLLFFHKLLTHSRLSSLREKVSVLKTWRGSNLATTFGKIRPMGFVQRKKKINQVSYCKGETKSQAFELPASYSGKRLVWHEQRTSACYLQAGVLTNYVIKIIQERRSKDRVGKENKSHISHPTGKI